MYWKLKHRHGRALPFSKCSPLPEEKSTLCFTFTKRIEFFFQTFFYIFPLRLLRFKPVLCSYLNFKIIDGYGFFQIFKIKEPLVLILGKTNKNQKQRTTGSSYFRNIKEPAVFMNEPAKNREYEKQFFLIFCEKQ